MGDYDKGFVDPLALDMELRQGDGPISIVKGNRPGSGGPLFGPAHSHRGADGDRGSRSGPISTSEGPTCRLLNEEVQTAISHENGLASEGEGVNCPLKEHGLLLEGVDVLNDHAKPTTVPPAGFQWQFLANVWVLAPVAVHKDIGKEGELGDSHVSESEDRDEEYESDEPIYEFERSIRELLPGLKEGESSPPTDVAKGVRKSERHKKPSSRWNEEAGFVAEPPRSTKMKVILEDPSEGAPSLPLAISDWSNSQIISYCNACGISFDISDGHLDACIYYICNVEKTRSLACVVSNLEKAETSMEVCGI